MLLEDWDRNIEIDAAIDADEVTGIRFEKHSPAADPRPPETTVAVLPHDAPEELVDAAELLVAAGYRISRADDAFDDTDTPQLSPRELEVLALLAEGAANKVIARRLDISVHTAKFHVASIIAKLGAANRTEATASAMRMGLVGE